MRAVICTAYGPPDVLQLRDVERPVPGNNEVLIKVRATTVHRGGCEDPKLAKSFGAEVTGVCGTANVELVGSLGADHVIDYTRQDLADSGSYDVVFDAVDKLASSRGKRALTKDGVYLNVNRDSGSGGGGSPEDLVFLTDLIEHGKIRAVIDRTYPMDQIVDAHRYVEQGHKKGHVVVLVANEG